MTPRALTVLFCLVPLTLVSSAALAQDSKPYAPHQYSRSELINFGTYDEPPLVFDLQVVDVAQQPEERHVNFVITVDEDYATVVDFFKSAYTSQEPVARLADGLMPFQSTRELRVVGHSAVDPARTAGFTLGGNDVTRRFTIEVSDDGGKTTLTMKNIIMSRLFSGVVPARAGFKPAGAKPVGLLYN